jgi:hypothetical protein
MSTSAYHIVLQRPLEQKRHIVSDYIIRASYPFQYSGSGTGLRTAKLGIRLPAKTELFFCATVSRPGLQSSG